MAKFFNLNNDGVKLLREYFDEDTLDSDFFDLKLDKPNTDIAGHLGLEGNYYCIRNNSKLRLEETVHLDISEYIIKGNRVVLFREKADRYMSVEESHYGDFKYQHRMLRDNSIYALVMNDSHASFSKFDTRIDWNFTNTMFSNLIFRSSYYVQDENKVKGYIRLPGCDSFVELPKTNDYVVKMPLTDEPLIDWLLGKENFTQVDENIGYVYGSRTHFNEMSRSYYLLTWSSDHPNFEPFEELLSNSYLEMFKDFPDNKGTKLMEGQVVDANKDRILLNHYQRVGFTDTFELMSFTYLVDGAYTSFKIDPGGVITDYTTASSEAGFMYKNLSFNGDLVNSELLLDYLKDKKLLPDRIVDMIPGKLKYLLLLDNVFGGIEVLLDTELEFLIEARLLDFYFSSPDKTTFIDSFFGRRLKDKDFPECYDLSLEQFEFLKSNPHYVSLGYVSDMRNYSKYEYRRLSESIQDLSINDLSTYLEVYHTASQMVIDIEGFQRATSHFGSQYSKENINAYIVKCFKNHEILEKELIPEMLLTEMIKQIVEEVAD